MRIKRRVSKTGGRTAADVRVVESAADESPKKEKRFVGPLPDSATDPVKVPWDCRVGLQTYRVKQSWWVDNTRRTLVVFQTPWRKGEWAVVHFASNVPLIYSAPSESTALKILCLVWPRINLAKLTAGFWIDAKEAVPEEVAAFIQHVWRADYTAEDQIPTVEQWQKSSLGNSFKKWTPFRGKIKVARKRKRAE